MQDLTGQKFGKLKVLELHHRERTYKKGKKNGFRNYYLCQCECGGTKIVRSDGLTSGDTSSCGCIKTVPVHTTHNLSNHRLYYIWKNIKSRCTNRNNKRYKDYGNRGILICNEWINNFSNFYNWAMANNYKDSLTIDRIDNNGNYEPSNCRWVTMKANCNNKRNNHLVTYNGKTNTLMEWSEVLKMPYSTLKRRLQRGWSVDKSFTTPIGK